MNGWGQDLRFALRALRKRRLVSFVVTVSLAVAIAGNVTVFSIINGLFFRPLPYQHPERLVLIGERYQGRANVLSTASAANLLDWSAENQVFQEVAGFKSGRLSLVGAGGPEPVAVAMVSASFFRVLGGQALLGRTFDPDQPREERVALLSQLFWESHYGADKSAVGRSIEIGGETHAIVGVLPRDFEFLVPNIQVWLPLTLDPAKAQRAEKDLLVVARLKPGVTTLHAKSEMAALGERLAKQYPEANRGYRVSVVNLREEIPDDRNRQAFGLLQGAMLFVLLIACANIANLLLARSRDRMREMAIFSALGASRWRVARQLLIESLLLAGAASALGLGGAAALVRVVAMAMASSLPRHYEPVIDGTVIAFTIGMGAAAGLLFGLAPALNSRMASFETLKEAGLGLAARPGRRFLVNSLVVAEIAASSVLLAGAGMLIQGFLELQNADPGFEMDGLLTVSMVLPQGQRYGDEQRLAAFYAALLETLNRVPKVEAASLTNGVPRSPSSPTASFSFRGMETAEQARAIWLTTSPDYLKTLRIPLIRGRFFSGADREGAPLVAVISEGMAQHYGPGQNSLGQYVTILGEERQIVGVVGNVRQSVASGNEGLQPLVYLPVAQQPSPNLTVVLRAADFPHQIARPVREAISGLDPEITITSVLTLEEYANQFLVGAQVFILLLTSFGIFALLLAAIGTYGVLAYDVTQRTREIGIRVALGAQRREVLRMVAVRGLRLAGIGLLIAVPGFLGLSRVVASVLAGLTEVRTSSMLVAGLVLLLAIVVACVAPARRAAAVDPVVAFRSS